MFDWLKSKHANLKGGPLTQHEIRPTTFALAASTPVPLQSVSNTEKEGIAFKKKFIREGANGDDLKRLSIAYLLQENSDLRAAILIIDGFRRRSEKGNNHKAFIVTIDISVNFVLQLAGVHEIIGEKSSVVILEFLSALKKLCDTLQILPATPVEEEAVTKELKIFQDTIASIRQRYSTLLDHDLPYSKGQWNIKFIDMPLTILDFLKDSCDLVPVPYLRKAVGVAIGLLKAVKQTRANHDDMSNVADMAGEFVLSLAVICSGDGANLSARFNASIEDFTKTLREIGEICEDSSRKSLLYRFMQQGTEKDKVSGLKVKLDHAINMFQSETQILQQVDIQRIKEDLDIVKDKLDIDTVNTLPKHPPYMAPKRSYMPGSQDDVMEEIATWIEKSPSPILWLCGAAGMGKSTISHQIVYSLMEAGRLATFFFFTSDQSESQHQRDPVAITKTLAREIASLHPRATAAVVKAIRAPQSSHQSLSAYLEQYVLSPIKTISTSHSHVVVLDAMNEWADRMLFLEALNEVINYLSGVKIIITSRPEKEFEDALANLPFTKVHLKGVDVTTVERYFNLQFKRISWNNRQPTDVQIKRLASLADGHLIWAATVCDYIAQELREDEPHRLFDRIFSSTKEIGSENKLGVLYRTSLTYMFGDEPSERASDFCRAFGAISVIQESLRVSDFEQLLQMSSPRLIRAVRTRLSALQTRGHYEDNIVSPASDCFHFSFLEFLTGPHAPPHLHISISNAHSAVAQACLQTLILFFKTQKDHSTMSRHVQYARDFWALHFSRATQDKPPNADLMVALTQFIGRPLRLWVHSFRISEDQSAAVKLDQQGDAGMLHRLAVLLEESESGGEQSLWRWIYIEQIAVFLAPQKNEKACYLAHLGSLFEKLYESTLKTMALDNAIDAFQEALDLRTFPHPDRTTSLNTLALAFESRFERSGQLDDLHKAVKLHWEALELRPPPHPDRWSSLNNLANALESLSKQEGSLDYLDQAIELHTKALELRPESHPDHSSSLNNLAVALINRFQRTGSSNDLDEAIIQYIKALNLRPFPHPHHTSTLNNLAIALESRYRQKLSISDLEKAIEMHRAVLESGPSLTNRSASLMNFGLALQSRFNQGNDLKDLDKAVAMCRESLDIRQHPHPKRFSSLNALAVALQSRFKKVDSKQDISDLNEAIHLLQEALRLCPPFHPDHFSALNDLAIAFWSRFGKSGSVDDLDEAIALNERAYNLQPSPSLDRLAMSLNNLALAFQSRYEHKGSLGDLNKSIEMHQQLLELRLPPHPDRATSLNNLGLTLYTRFNQIGSQEDLKVAIFKYREVLELYPSHPVRFLSVRNLADALESRSIKMGIKEDLDKVIELRIQALELHPFPGPEHLILRNKLSNALVRRFEQKKSPEDLDNIISLNEKSLKLYSSAQSDLSLPMYNLASALMSRFGQNDSMEDLEKAVLLRQETLQLRPPPHPERPNSLNHLGLVLYIRFSKTGRPLDITDAIKYFREALQLYSPSSSNFDHSSVPSNLANSLWSRFEKSGSSDDLNEAIDMFRRATELRPPPHPERALALVRLVHALQRRFYLNNVIEDLDEVIANYRELEKGCPPHHPKRSDLLKKFAIALESRYKRKGAQEDQDEARSLLSSVRPGKPSTSE